LSNFPPGVTGNEWAIRGPIEKVEEKHCDECEDDFDVVVHYSGPANSTGSATFCYWECPECGREYESDVEIDDGADDAYDEWIDRKIDEHFDDY